MGVGRSNKKECPEKTPVLRGSKGFRGVGGNAQINKQRFAKHVEGDLKVEQVRLHAEAGNW